MRRRDNRTHIGCVGRRDSINGVKSWWVSRDGHGLWVVVPLCLLFLLRNPSTHLINRMDPFVHFRNGRCFHEECALGHNNAESVRVFLDDDRRDSVDLAKVNHSLEGIFLVVLIICQLFITQDEPPLFPSLPY